MFLLSSSWKSDADDLPPQGEAAHDALMTASNLQQMEIFANPVPKPWRVVPGLDSAPPSSIATVEVKRRAKEASDAETHKQRRAYAIILLEKCRSCSTSMCRTLCRGGGHHGNGGEVMMGEGRT